MKAQTPVVKKKKKKKYFTISITGFFRDTGLDEFESWYEDDGALEELRNKPENVDIFEWPPEFFGRGRDAEGKFRIIIKDDEAHSHRLASEVYSTLTGRRVHGHAVRAKAEDFKPIDVYY